MDNLMKLTPEVIALFSSSLVQEEQGKHFLYFRGLDPGLDPFDITVLTVLKVFIDGTWEIAQVKTLGDCMKTLATSGAMSSLDAATACGSTSCVGEESTDDKGCSRPDSD
jgi:hypothetical protein